MKLNDYAGDAALKILEIAYVRAKIGERPLEELNDIREAICLVRGWEFKP